jgi:hypothetical protein
MSKERELLKRAIYFLEPLDWEENVSLTCQDLIKEITELLAQPELGLTPRKGIPFYKKGYKRGYNAAVMDLKRKVDNVFNLIMEDDDE